MELLKYFSQKSDERNFKKALKKVNIEKKEHLFDENVTAENMRNYERMPSLMGSSTEGHMILSSFIRKIIKKSLFTLLVLSIVSLNGCSQSSIEDVISSLQDDNPRVRVNAAEKLGKSGDPKAIEPLIKALADRGEYKTRRKSLQPTISGGEVSWEYRRSTLEVQPSIAFALAEFGSDAVDPLINALDSENSWVRKGAIATLRLIKDQRVVSPILLSLKDSSKDVRLSAIESLGQVYSNTKDERTLIATLNYLQDRDERVRKKAISVLKYCKFPEAATPLLKALRVEKNAYIRADIVQAIGKAIPDEDKKSKTVEPFVEHLAKLLLYDTDKWVRVQVANELSSFKNILSVNVLMKALLYDPDERVRKEAAEALGCLNDPRATNALNTALKDSVRSVRKTAKESLDKLK